MVGNTFRTTTSCDKEVGGGVESATEFTLEFTIEFTIESTIEFEIEPTIEFTTEFTIEPTTAKTKNRRTKLRTRLRTWLGTGRGTRAERRIFPPICPRHSGFTDLAKAKLKDTVKDMVRRGTRDAPGGKHFFRQLALDTADPPDSQSAPHSSSHSHTRFDLTTSLARTHARHVTHDTSRTTRHARRTD